MPRGSRLLVVSFLVFGDVLPADEATDVALGHGLAHLLEGNAWSVGGAEEGADVIGDRLLARPLGWVSHQPFAPAWGHGRSVAHELIATVPSLADEAVPHGDARRQPKLV
jgi:hypothetical protein